MSTEAKQKLVQTLDAYKEFAARMKELQEEEKQIVRDAIKKHNDQNMQVIRDKIASL